MRVVVQRVSSASVVIGSRLSGQIERGLVVFVGIQHDDTGTDGDWLAGKLARLRIFADENRHMNRNLAEADGAILLISQFTLHASTRKGARPSFNQAAAPERARPLYELFVRQLSNATGRTVATGEFGADMQVSLVNDGPVTILLDSRQRE